MNSGSCLCAKVTWEVIGDPEITYHCHCKICRKAHGAAFVTFWWFSPENFRWTGSRDSIVKFSAVPGSNRAFCSHCGSAVPGEFAGRMFSPAGCHDEGMVAQSNIFVAHKAPWHDITGDLPQYEDFPPDMGGGALFGTLTDLGAPMADPELAPKRSGGVRGGCLCGAIEFEVVEPFKVVHNCHCSRCRRARAAAHTTNGFTSMKGVIFSKGEEHIKTYKVPGAQHFTHAFCDSCGCGMPRIDPGRQIAVTPLGALDDDPGTKAVDNIFVAHKAQWYEITDDLPSYEEGPPT